MGLGWIWFSVVCTPSCTVGMLSTKLVSSLFSKILFSGLERFKQLFVGPPQSRARKIRQKERNELISYLVTNKVLTSEECIALDGRICVGNTKTAQLAWGDGCVPTGLGQKTRCEEFKELDTTASEKH